MTIPCSTCNRDHTGPRCRRPDELTQSVQVTIPRPLLAALDDARGTEPRSSVITRLLRDHMREER